jgi:hypothetical protein
MTVAIAPGSFLIDDENDAVAGIDADVTPRHGSKSAGSALAARGKSLTIFRCVQIVTTITRLPLLLRCAN